ncbi:MAG: SAM-dependent chlorinase/fluorinase [Gemmatimonadota bacterium]|nr:SAM-dependent chlorinase/fluorinase [Gemmatimonadota bacterium]
MNPTSRTITLLTDFGTADGYVAEMKGVLLSQTSNVGIIDISHDIPPQDIEAARLAVARYWRRFPPGTVHLVVVDPAVGSERAAIAVASGGQFLVGPDNGVLSPALFSLDATVVALGVTKNSAATFHGRDVFAPAAASLASGVSLGELGDWLPSPIRLRTAEATRRTDGSIAGKVLTIDRFGNALTNLVTRSTATVLAAGLIIPVVRTYADASVGTVVAVVGSNGFIEIAVRNGNAANLLQLERGSEVVLYPTSR